jgi:hypothetical protein
MVVASRPVWKRVGRQGRELLWIWRGAGRPAAVEEHARANDRSVEPVTRSSWSRKRPRGWRPDHPMPAAEHTTAPFDADAADSICRPADSKRAAERLRSRPRLERRQRRAQAGIRLARDARQSRVVAHDPQRGQRHARPLRAASECGGHDRWTPLGELGRRALHGAGAGRDAPYRCAKGTPLDCEGPAGS